MKLASIVKQSQKNKTYQNINNISKLATFSYNEIELSEWIQWSVLRTRIILKKNNDLFCCKTSSSKNLLAYFFLFLIWTANASPSGISHSLYGCQFQSGSWRLARNRTLHLRNMTTTLHSRTWWHKIRTKFCRIGMFTFLNMPELPATGSFGCIGFFVLRGLGEKLCTSDKKMVKKETTNLCIYLNSLEIQCKSM